ncbi:hypothetical protein GCM10010451_14720 [Streptomyces virens]|uniref:Secreted protein n=1 Tax=Streptomyces virens TaxID=285572 RepID=A0ABP6P544_9ACTN
MLPLAAMSSLCFCAASVRVAFTVTGEQPALARSALTSSTTRAVAEEDWVPPVAAGLEAGALGFGAAVVGFGAAVVGSGAVVAGREVDASGAVFFGLCDGFFECFCDGLRDGFCDGSALPGLGVPAVEGLVPAAGVSVGAAVGSPCCWLLHRLYQSGPQLFSGVPGRAVLRSCRSPPPGQSVQAMATEGMPMTPTATAATTVRRYCC